MQKNDVNKPETIKNIMPLIEQAAEESGLLLLEVNFVQESGKWHLKIFLYNPEAPVTHENCQTVTKKISEQLNEIIPIHFYLEVSSPGSDRKLKSEKEYEIFKEKRVKIKVKKNVEKEQKIFLAIIKDYTEENGLEIAIIGEEGTLKLKQKDISYVKLEPEYNYI